uniref:cyclic AMP-responsive element-binding protein 3-like protein 4 n=1 Tax=Myxine glutinosa TaxID=7769 RepID=UPI00358DFEB4
MDFFWQRSLGDEGYAGTMSFSSPLPYPQQPNTPDQGFLPTTDLLEDDWGFQEPFADTVQDNGDAENLIDSLLAESEGYGSPPASDSGISEPSPENSPLPVLNAPPGMDISMTPSPVTTTAAFVNQDQNIYIEDEGRTGPCPWPVSMEDRTYCQPMTSADEDHTTCQNPTTTPDDWEAEPLLSDASLIMKSLPTLTAALRSSRQLFCLSSSDTFPEPNMLHDMTLTDEEKKLLVQEGVVLPAHVPLTKTEERLLKKVRRKIRNKQSAQESRRRKKEYVDGLESRVATCTTHNYELQRKVHHLEQQNTSLLSQLRRLQEMVRNTSTKGAQTGTCVMVFLVSFALIIYPSYSPITSKTPSHLYQPQRVLSRSLADAQSSRVIPTAAGPDGTHRPEPEPTTVSRGGKLFAGIGVLPQTITAEEDGNVQKGTLSQPSNATLEEEDAVLVSLQGGETPDKTPDIRAQKSRGKSNR